MKKQEIIKHLDKMKTGFINQLDKSCISKNYRAGFCFYLHECLPKITPIERKLILKSLFQDIEKNRRFRRWNRVFWYPTIETDGFFRKNKKTFFERIVGLSKEKKQVNNEILQRRIDHIDRTIQRLQKEILLETKVIL